MSELSVRLAQLKASKTTKAAVKKANVSRETFRRIERGDSVKRSTLKKIADALNASEKAWLELEAAWIEYELGPDADKFIIQIKNKPSQSSPRYTEVVQLFRKLSHEQRLQLLKAVQRPEIMRALPALNAIYDHE